MCKPTNDSPRDYFAALAMQQLMDDRDKVAKIPWDAIARDAYTMADAMMDERDKGRDPESGGYLPDRSAPIDALCLTQRTTKMLRKEGIETIEQLLDCTHVDLLKLPACGKKSAKEIEIRVSGYGGLKNRQVKPVVWK